ncbi:DNA repair protein RecN [Clostridium fallax]|uniref:DNA repair protein RecN n=1 Tax=Clostridium fallax TaxID=1533 RepID=A0A1M4XMH2_9CLOT|nr:DNA repair protein RecN [Clostridium fallax]SHE94453.1 DNA replication and repair protein RecN [Clostridium fallax]SQB06355.1 DNA repair protein RecN [Clostridium fallax]
MLLQLTIENFALIKNISISFNEGFNILSGETGAGKSILIDAIAYVLGGKFNKDLIRTGENKTFVEAVFTIENQKTKDILEELNIEYDDLIIITRETYQNGKSITKVNNKTVILSIIKKISDAIIDIHGQHNNQSLLNKGSHIHYLDSYGDENLYSKLKEYKKIYEEIKNLDKKIEELSGKEDRERVLEFLKFQIDDINEAKLKLGEEEELKERYNLLSNSEKIAKTLSLTCSTLKGSMENESILDKISYIAREIYTIEKHSDKIKLLNERLNEIYYSLEDISREFASISEEIIYDEEELENINSRIYKISSLKKKYGESIESILSYRDKISNQYTEMINAESILKELSIKKLEKVKILKEIGNNITSLRKNIAKKLEEKIIYELNEVGLEKSRFIIGIKELENYNDLGLDDVQFTISTNLGEPLRPLDKIVSGGELSRIMLALKIAFIDKDEIPTVIFDEIDTGISGRIAQAVGEKMYELSIRHQVFCITHLPQIAALSDHHYLIFKKTLDNLTYSNIEKVDLKTKTEEIAKMIGGAEVTQNTKANAKDMIMLADKKKKDIIKIYT